MRRAEYEVEIARDYKYRLVRFPWRLYHLTAVTKRYSMDIMLTARSWMGCQSQERHWKKCKSIFGEAIALYLETLTHA
jgi:hypothetical protein